MRCAVPLLFAATLAPFAQGESAPAGAPAPAPQSDATAKPAPAKPATPPVFFAGNEWFDIASDRVAAAAYVASVGERVAIVLARYGFRPYEVGATKVVVYVHSDGAPLTFEDDARRTLVRVPLDVVPGTSTAVDFARERAVARALVSGALRRLTHAAGRTPAPSDWIVEALAWEAQFGSHPGLLEWLVRTADEQGPGTLAQLATPNPDGLGSHSRAAVLLLRAVKQDNPGDMRAVIAKAALGLPPPDCIRAAVPRLADGKESPETWWPAVFYREIDRRPPAVAGPGASAVRFAALTRFVVAETPPGGATSVDVVLDVPKLVARRADRSVDAAVARRLADIKLALLTVNPVWFNALRDYGVFLEKLRTPGVAEAELFKAAAQAGAEAEAARRLTAEVERALRGGLDAR